MASYEIKRNSLPQSQKTNKYLKKSKSKSIRLANKEVVKWIKIEGDELKSLRVNIDPRCGWAD